jgi:predicted nucleic acid-binding protein
LLSFHVYDFTKQAAQHATRLEFDLEKKGTKIKRTDIMIASIAIIQGAILCTFDSDFQKTKEFGLKLFR